MRSIEQKTCWIPFKFLERSIAVISTEDAQRLSAMVKFYYVEEKSWTSHQDIGERIPADDLGRTCVSILVRHRDIGHQEIGVSKNK